MVNSRIVNGVSLPPIGNFGQPISPTRLLFGSPVFTHFIDGVSLPPISNVRGTVIPVSPTKLLFSAEYIPARELTQTQTLANLALQEGSESNLPLILGVGIGGVALVGVIVTIVIVMKKKKRGV